MFLILQKRDFKQTTQIKEKTHEKEIDKELIPQNNRYKMQTCITQYYKK